MKHKFSLNQKVKIKCSDEYGKVNGIAFYAKNPDHPKYLMMYKNAQGCAVEEWWDEDAIEEKGSNDLTLTTVTFNAK